MRTSIIAACKAYALGKSKLDGGEGRHRITHFWVRLLEAQSGKCANCSGCMQ